MVNAGAITSAGNLNAIAGFVINALPVGAYWRHCLDATNDSISVYAGSGNVVNGGSVSALQGNINLSSALTSNLSVNIPVEHFRR